MGKRVSADRKVKEIRRKTRRTFSAEENVRIVLEGLRGEESIAELCRSTRPGERGPNIDQDALAT